jgi:hypothetical protein
MTMSGHTGFLAASDAVRFIMFGVLMTLLLGSVAWASFIDERKQTKRVCASGPTATATANTEAPAKERESLSLMGRSLPSD